MSDAHRSAEASDSVSIDPVESARIRVKTVTCDEVRRRLDAGDAVVLVDVRESAETDGGIVPGAVPIPRGFLEFRIGEQASPLRDVVVYCESGIRSLLAARTLQDMGYTRVSSLEGGFSAWKEGEHPWMRPPGLTDAQRRRYGRHLRLPEVGEEGQSRLLDARILLVGMGGLGSPAALYLAAAGVGTLGLVDDDAVDESNLQRQILHSTETLGWPKTASARRRIESLNPDVRVVEHRLRLTFDTAIDLLRGYDVVVDGSDNFSTRYALNDVCVRLGVPLVHGAIFRFTGQVTTIVPGQSPCYRCLFPSPPPPGAVPACQEAGVLGVLPGVVGTMQAVEAIKLVLNLGHTLQGRLLTYDALDPSVQELRYRRDPRCHACGTR